MSSTFLRDEIRKNNNVLYKYNNLNIAMSGNGLRLAGETGNPFVNNYKEPQITKQTIPKSRIHNSDDIRTTGLPRNRYKNVGPVNPYNTKGTPMIYNPGKYADLADAFESGDALPFITDSAAAIGELLMGLL